MVRLGRKCAALPGFEVHQVFTLPWHVALAVMFENALPALSQHRKTDSKTSVRRLGSGNRLKQQIDRRAALQSG